MAFSAIQIAPVEEIAWYYNPLDTGASRYPSGRMSGIARDHHRSQTSYISHSSLRKRQKHVRMAVQCISRSLRRQPRCCPLRNRLLLPHRLSSCSIRRLVCCSTCRCRETGSGYCGPPRQRRLQKDGQSRELPAKSPARLHVILPAASTHSL